MSHEGDWHRVFDAAGIRPEPFNGRMLLWLNGEMGRAFGSLGEAQHAFAAHHGAFNWSALDHVTLASELAQLPVGPALDSQDDDLAIPEVERPVANEPFALAEPARKGLWSRFVDYWLVRDAA